MDSRVLSQLRAIVGAGRVLLDKDDLARYGVDSTTLWRARPAAVVLPDSCEQVRDILLLANRRRLALVPSGGRTGLSGGAVAANGEIVLSLERMNRILAVDSTAQSLRCEAGVTTAAVQAAAEEEGLYYPVDFASAGSSQIGGNVATNAGGTRVIRYGSTRNWVLGLKVVTGAGDILDLNRGLVKNNTGLDFRHLFIGSEGILGVICEATLALTARPRNLSVAVLGVRDVPALMAVLETAKQQLQLCAFEFFTAAALDEVVAATRLQPPFPSRSPCYALVEFEGREAGGEQEGTAFFQDCADRGWVEDGVISRSETQAAQLWRLRESITDSISRWQPYKQDISVGSEQIPGFVAEVDRLLQSRFAGLRALWFGHVGDGNVHLNILKPEDFSPDQFAALCTELGEAVFERVAAFGGSISAEHGIGLLKKPFLHYSRSGTEIALMKAVKKVFDPRGILNPGKVFDRDT